MRRQQYSVAAVKLESLHLTPIYNHVFIPSTLVAQINEYINDARSLFTNSTSIGLIAKY